MSGFLARCTNCGLEGNFQSKAMRDEWVERHPAMCNPAKELDRLTREKRIVELERDGLMLENAALTEEKFKYKKALEETMPEMERLETEIKKLRARLDRMDALEHN